MPITSAPSGIVACLVTPAAKSAYGRPSRSATERETASICAFELVVDTQRRARDPRDELDRAVVVGRPETARDEADVGVARGAQRGLEIVRVVADDHDPLGRETERERLARVERAVPVVALAAHELAARDDDRRAAGGSPGRTAVPPASATPRCAAARRVAVHLHERRSPAGPPRGTAPSS